MNAGGLSEKSRIPAQVNDIIVLTQIFPDDPEHTLDTAHKLAHRSFQFTEIYSLRTTWYFLTIVKFLCRLGVKLEVLE